MEVKIVRISDSGNSAMVNVPQSGRNYGTKNAYTKLLPEEIGKVQKGDFIEISDDFSLVTREDEAGETLVYPDGNPVLFIEEH